MFQSPELQCPNTAPGSLQSHASQEKPGFRQQGPSCARCSALRCGYAGSPQDQTVSGRHLWPHCMTVAPYYLLQGGSSPDSPRLQESCSVSAPGWHQNSLGSKGDRGLTSSLACLLCPMLGGREAAHGTPTSSAFSRPLAQHPTGVHTHPLGLSRIQAQHASPVLRKGRRKLGKEPFLMLSLLVPSAFLN